VSLPETFATTLNTVWDLKHFQTARKPLSLGHVDIPWTGLRILDMPIKFPRTDYRIPQELSAYLGFILQVVGIEERLNDQHDKYYAYLTVDSGVVKGYQSQRNPGLHVDGFQGARQNPKVWAGHSYIACDTLPTRFYNQPFSCDGLDEARDNFFHAFDRQALPASVVDIIPNTINYMDAYCVHESVKTTQTVGRTFLRLSYSVRQFDRLGNTHNPMLMYNWEMVPRDFQGSLAVASVG